jgi:site-specific DNA recombinase
VKPYAIYARVSSLKQADNFSTPAQLQLMHDNLAEQGHEVIELAEVGSAYTRGLERSKLNEALNLARTGQIEALMFFSPDRFTRDMGDGVILRRELRRHGVKLFCFYPAPYEITSDQEIMHVLTDWRNEEFIRSLTVSSMRSVKAKVDAKMFPQGTAPYGYRLQGEKRNTEIIKDLEEEETIRLITNWYYYHGLGVTEIAKRLNDRGIPSPKNTRGATEWTPRAIRKILGKKAYTGIWYAYTWKHVDGKWIKLPEKEENAIPIPEIIPLSLWERVQEKLSSRHAGKLEDSQYLMSCRLKCKCGSHMSGKRTTTSYRGTLCYYYYYRCNQNHEGTIPCKEKYMSAGDVDETVWQFALEFIQNPTALLEGLRQMQDEDKEKYDFARTQIGHLEEEITEGERTLASLVDQRSHTQSSTLTTILDERIEKIALAVDGIKKRRDILKIEQGQEPFSDEHIAAIASEVEEVRKMFEALHVINQEADFEAKQALIGLLDLTATVRRDELGQVWVDIVYLRKNYSRPLLPQKTIAQRR